MIDSPYDQLPDENEVTCRECGQTGLHWEHVGAGHYRLFDDNEQRHECVSRKNRDARIEDFNEVKS